ncbi:MAG TPA: hypothetical protein VKM55_19200 [Candidatus Lokiarchaeia archaeon]|nr:hypothetical protein [Candidatus Lokiarchaeia archaeon]
MRRFWLPLRVIVQQGNEIIFGRNGGLKIYMITYAKLEPECAVGHVIRQRVPLRSIQEYLVTEVVLGPLGRKS